MHARLSKRLNLTIYCHKDTWEYEETPPKLSLDWCGFLPYNRTRKNLKTKQIYAYYGDGLFEIKFRFFSFVFVAGLDILNKERHLNGRPN